MHKQDTMATAKCNTISRYKIQPTASTSYRTQEIDKCCNSSTELLMFHDYIEILVLVYRAHRRPCRHHLRLGPK